MGPAYGEPAVEAPAPHWTYQGLEGPANWGNLSAEYAACRHGRQQSPVNIVKPTGVELAELEFDYGAVPVDLVNTGHTVEVRVPAGNLLRIGKRELELKQIHFHGPAEHMIEGRISPIEVHLVHQSEDGRYGVVGIMIEVGEENRLFESLSQHAPKSATATYRDGAQVLELTDLLPEERNYVRYFGSLTTPPCTEGVDWYVMSAPVEATDSQIGMLRDVMGENARPAQPLNDRFILTSE